MTPRAPDTSPRASMGLQRPFPTLSMAGVLVAMALLSPVAVDASSLDLAGDRPPPKWANEKEYVKCDQACLYERGNENLSLNALYMVNRLNLLKQLHDDGKETLLRENLGDFCPPSETSTSDCYLRYRQVQLDALRKVKTSIGFNMSMVAKLRGYNEASGKMEPETMNSFAVTVEEGEKAKKPLVPEAPTLEELKQEYARLRSLTEREYQEWVKTIPAKPSPDDFAKFKVIDRDPSKPGGEKLTVVETDAQGKVVFDQAKYAKAMAEYNQRMKTIKTELDMMGRNRNNMAVHRPKKMDDSVVAPESQQIYHESRFAVVSASNDAIAAAMGAPAAGPSKGRGAKGGSGSQLALPKEIQFAGAKPPAPAANGGSATTAGRGPAGASKASTAKKDAPRTPHKPATGKEEIIQPPAREGKNEHFAVSVYPVDLEKWISEIEKEGP